jgi:Ca2+-binding RTX toxin-like protein
VRKTWSAAIFLASVIAFAAVAGSARSQESTCFGAAPTIVGNDGDNVLNGTPGPDVILAHGGNDQVRGLGGDDRICGGAGFDILWGDDGNDALDGGGDSFDDVVGGPGADELQGGPGIEDLADYSGSPSSVSADLTTGSASGGEGSDHLGGLEGLVGSAHDDNLTGDGGANSFVPLGGNDVVQGGNGADRVAFYFAPSSVTADLAAGSATGEGSDRIMGVENLAGSDHADSFTGNGEDNILLGRPGNDTLTGGAGDDSVIGDEGDDQLDGGADQDDVSYLGVRSGGVSVDLAAGRALGGGGSDRISGVENVTGSPQSDVIYGDSAANNLVGAGGDDAIRGREGFDTASFIFSPAAVDANLATGKATGEGSDTLGGIESMIGSGQNDTLTGNALPNALSGFGGSDVINGAGAGDLLVGDFGGLPEETPGNDILRGQAGDDLLMGGPADDQFIGGAGTRDEATYIFSEARVAATLASGTATGQGSDRLSDIERLTGSEFDDVLVGNSRPNLISGRGGNDRISGAGADDFLSGGGGTDALDAANGRDYCLDDRKGRSCEITGLPSARPTGASFVAGPQSGRVHDDLGTPRCGGTAGLKLAALGASPQRRKRHPISIAPPQRVRAPVTRRAILELFGLKPAQVGVPTERVTWRGVLFRFDAKRRRWVRQLSTPVLSAIVDPSRTATWANSKGRPIERITLRVPPGRYAWAADQNTGDGRVFDWIEPHVKPKGKGLFQQGCEYAR